MINDINIKFKENTANPIKTRRAGTVAIILKDSTKTGNIHILNSTADIKGFNTDSTNALNDLFTAGVKKVIVLNSRDSYTVDNCITALDTITANYICVLSEDNADHVKLSKYIQGITKKYGTKMGVLYKVDNTNCPNLRNFVNEKVTFNDDRGEVAGYKAIPYITGVLASMPLSRGAKGFVLTLLKSVENVDNIEDAVNNGKLVLNYNGQDVRIVAGVTTLTSVDAENTESMKSIVINEALNLIRDNINEAFKNYIGAYKNKYSVQMLIISSIKGYFKELESLEVLDSEYDNTAEIDADAMRIYWQKKGRTEIADLSDNEIKKYTCGKNVYIKASIKLLEVVEKFDITINLTV